jgi:hypothetical protein
MLLGSFLSVSARADDVLHPGAASLDPPTLVALGVQLLITGDDNHSATVALRYRKTGTTAFQDALPLFRVHPENVTGFTVPEEFAGSVFDLQPWTRTAASIRSCHCRARRARFPRIRKRRTRRA